LGSSLPRKLTGSLRITPAPGSARGENSSISPGIPTFYKLLLASPAPVVRGGHLRVPTLRGQLPHLLAGWCSICSLSADRRWQCIIERWEDPEYSRCYEKIWPGRWQEYDRCNADHRVRTKMDLYDGAGSCGVWRGEQGWVCPLSTSTSTSTVLYILLAMYCTTQIARLIIYLHHPL